MKEQDRRAVEGMARSGMELEVLLGCFPSFPKEEVTDVYCNIHLLLNDYREDTQLSRNCS
ncbi:MAG: hypothetical protein K6E84_10050 [Lachnospiraceae bacterium]|nr:hypothetical protein [Lachnospiraceae bacterium]